MRIISGKARGTKLYTLEGEHTRPTLDRVKESMFNIINSEIMDSTVLDLFSGSGAIGLEFASRGAKKVYLCDNSKSAIEIIKKNIEKTHLKDIVEVFNYDFKDVLKELSNEKIKFIFLDPPYKTDYVREALEEIIQMKNIDEESTIIIETDDIERIKEYINNSEKTIKITDQRKYGRANLVFLRKTK